MGPVSATDDYLNLFLHFPNISPDGVLAAFFLLLARLLPIVSLAPFLGGKNVPAIIKMGFSLSLAAIFLPQVLVTLKGPLELNMEYALYFVKELLFGLIIGIMSMVPFLIAQSSGSLIDHMRGAASLQVTDPGSQVQTSVVGLFYNYILIAIFFILGGPFIFFNAIAHSFQVVPVNQFINPIFFHMNVPFWQLVIGLLTFIMSMAIQLGAPSIVGILMAEMFLGIANRLSPQVQIVFLGIPLKSWVGQAMMALAWYFIINQLGKESLKWIQTMTNLIEQLPVSS